MKKYSSLILVSLTVIAFTTNAMALTNLCETQINQLKLLQKKQYMTKYKGSNLSYDENGTKIRLSNRTLAELERRHDKIKAKATMLKGLLALNQKYKVYQRSLDNFDIPGAIDAFSGYDFRKDERKLNEVFDIISQGKDIIPKFHVMDNLLNEMDELYKTNSGSVYLTHREMKVDLQEKLQAQCANKQTSFCKKMSSNATEDERKVVDGYITAFATAHFDNNTQGNLSREVVLQDIRKHQEILTNGLPTNLSSNLPYNAFSGDEDISKLMVAHKDCLRKRINVSNESRDCFIQSKTDNNSPGNVNILERMGTYLASEKSRIQNSKVKAKDVTDYLVKIKKAQKRVEELANNASPDKALGGRSAYAKSIEGSKEELNRAKNSFINGFNSEKLLLKTKRDARAVNESGLGSIKDPMNSEEVKLLIKDLLGGKCPGADDKGCDITSMDGNKVVLDELKLSEVMKEFGNLSAEKLKSLNDELRKAEKDISTLNKGIGHTKNRNKEYIGLQKLKDHLVLQSQVACKNESGGLNASIITCNGINDQQSFFKVLVGSVKKVLVQTNSKGREIASNDLNQICDEFLANNSREVFNRDYLPICNSVLSGINRSNGTTAANEARAKETKDERAHRKLTENYYVTYDEDGNPDPLSIEEKIDTKHDFLTIGMGALVNRGLPLFVMNKNLEGQIDYMEFYGKEEKLYNARMEAWYSSPEFLDQYYGYQNADYWNNSTFGSPYQYYQPNQFSNLSSTTELAKGFSF